MTTLSFEMPRAYAIPFGKYVKIWLAELSVLTTNGKFNP